MMKDYTYEQVLGDRFLTLHVSHKDRLELRFSSENEEAPFKLAQRAANCFFTAFALYPTSITLHPAHLTVIRMQHQEVIAKVHILYEGLATGLPDYPIPWEEDEGLPLDTVAVRFTVDAETFSKHAVDSLLEILKLTKPKEQVVPVETTVEDVTKVDWA